MPEEIKYPDINCKENDPKYSTQKVLSKQKFCEYPNATPSSRVEVTGNLVKLTGTINIPKNCNNSRKFDPTKSNIEYECSGLCPVVNSTVPQSRLTTPASCDILSTTTGPNVVLVHKSKDFGISVGSPSSSSLIVGASSYANYNQINAYTEGDKYNICPKDAWTVIANTDGTFKEDKTDYKNCYCPWTKIRKYESVYNSAISKYVGKIKCADVNIN